MNQKNMTGITVIPGVYMGDRGTAFKTLITGVLKKGVTKTRYLNILTDAESMRMYSDAFTSELVDEDRNYQVYEQLGDLTGNKFIVWYIYRRFPQLKCAEGVKVAARLRINYGAKQSFFSISQKLGFWDFISATNDLRMRKMKSLLEDVFEAFLGVTETILDDRVRPGVGYAVVYNILKSIFDEIDISLKYEDLYDAKTRIKELFDLHGQQLGPIVYRESKGDVLTTSVIFRVEGGRYETKPNGTVNTNKIIGGTYIKIGEGSASLKADAQQRAAADALSTLNKQGWVKRPPAIYSRFANGETDSKSAIDELKSDTINDLVSTRDKTKYQSKYTSTRVAQFCRKRDYKGVKKCLKLGADVNIPDIHGLKCLDLLLIGDAEPVIVKKIMKKILKTCDMQISKQIYHTYLTRYLSDPFFRDLASKLALIDS